ncbi:alpha/beta fold hydrolase [Petrotoga sp. 9PWA.NaAc.5.4]|uniref:alpha/beta fold hydrolase n=1 Tax=Petrotoga sp. 9PWA.NaAc.5.4 TaxID=1434328 RepID=UPI000CB1E5B0|nr:alpha/beta fold hydrolase [Petrotoga sp. 9PWA.NaAc.5.4]PNR95715.1 lysophospholipase [Petrotoga sp. 9PWA.NaAc.5.4]
MNIYNRYFLSKKRNGKKIFLIHGLGEYSGRYKTFINLLNNKGYDVYTFDLPGHGYSFGSKGDIENFYEVYAFLEEYISNDYILLGHSLGGLIATRFVEITEKKPKKLILSSPALGNISQMKILLNILSIFPKLVVSNRINPYDLSTNQKSCQEYIEDPLVHDKITVQTALQMFEEAEIALREIDSINVPTILLYGEEDKVVNPYEYEKIKNANFEVFSFSKGKHELFECIYNKEKFLNKIFEFLK